MKKRGAITQREARRLRARVAELEKVLQRQRDAWAADWPNGTNVAAVGFESADAAAVVAVRVARRLGHAVVAVDNGARLALLALPLEGNA